MNAAPVVEIVIKVDSSGTRFALYRVRGTANLAWRYVNVRQAERALKRGEFRNLRAVAEGAK